MSIEGYFYRRHVSRAVVQGAHAARIQSLYRDIRKAAEQEFTEDNWPTLRAFLEEQFEAAMDEPTVPGVRP